MAHQLKECKVMLVRYVVPTKRKGCSKASDVSKKKSKKKKQPKAKSSNQSADPTSYEATDRGWTVSLNEEAETIEHESDPEDMHKQLIQLHHGKAAEAYEKVRVDQCNVAWNLNLANVADCEQDENLLGTWPPPKRKIKRALNLNRRPRKELPESELEPEVVVPSVRYTKKDRRRCRKIQLTMIPEVERNPPMIHWTETPINYRVEDGEFLANYPYLGEDVDPDFENELYDLYGEKDYNTEHKPFMADEIFLETINNYEKSLLKRQKRDLKEGTSSNWNTGDLTKVKRYGVMMPARSVFSAMVNCFPYLGFPYELEERYAKIWKASNAVSTTEADNLPDSPNVDESLTDDVDPDKALSAYQKLFCTRCLVYCCITHDADDHVDSRYQKFSTTKQEVEAVTVCENSDCILKPEKPKSSKKKSNDPKKAENDEWKPHEITMCKLLFRTAKHNSCYISSILVTKTCRQVRDYLQSELGVVFPDPPEPVEPTAPIVKPKKDEKIKNSDPGEKYVPRLDTVDSADFPHYRPCSHGENEGCNTKNMCCCVLASTYCERWCSCPTNCPRRFKGCSCKSTCNTIACPCYRANRECDPTLCLKCGSETAAYVEGNCRNVAILHRREKPIELKKSDVAGWGGFIGCDVKKWELVAEYRGEVISQTESSRRAFYYEKIRHTYLFSLNEDLVVDATRIGSKVRFVNSSKHPNCYAKVMMVNGDNRIGIYAKRNIDCGEELFFDYENIIKKTEEKGPGRRKSSKSSKSTKAEIVKKRK